MKTFISATVAALALMASSAQAETYNLSTHGAWTVAYNTGGNNGPYCDMTAATRDNELFALTVDRFDEYDVYFSFPVTRDLGREMLAAWENYELRAVDVTIGRTDWLAKIDHFSILQDGSAFILVERVTYEFRGAMAGGRSISIHPDVAPWSLNGSTAALAALDECRRRLGGA